jgi:hypothetical protein
VVTIKMLLQAGIYATFFTSDGKPAATMGRTI